LGALAQTPPLFGSRQARRSSQPAIPEPCTLQPCDDIGAGAHQTPEKIGAVVLKHQYHGANVDAEVVARCPTHIAIAVNIFEEAQIETAPEAVFASDLWVDILKVL
jgi:hypothetical protein